MCQICVPTMRNSQRDWQMKKLQFWQLGKGLFVPSEAWETVWISTQAENILTTCLHDQQ